MPISDSDNTIPLTRPAPNQKVIDTLEACLAAAKRGELTSIIVIGESVADGITSISTEMIRPFTVLGHLEAVKLSLLS